MKLETWLRMTKIPFEMRSLTSRPKSRTGKVPYIERDDGSLLSDSSAIIEVLREERGVTLDDHLSPEQRATATLLQRTFEEHLYWVAVHDRWLVNANWKLTKQAYFGTLPAALRWFVPDLVRAQVRRDAIGQGLARLPQSERDARARRDLQAIATLLGEGEYFFSKPSSIDAVAYAFLSNVLHVPLDTELEAIASEYDNLAQYTRRMKARYYGD
jgi:glutathione S-transferase